VKVGHRVIVPSTPGYCDTESPFPHEYYTFRRIASDLVTLLSTLGIDKALYIGHDWGSIIVQRVALWFPSHVIAVAAICVPFAKPTRSLVPLEKLVERFPNFAYQLWFASYDADKELQDPKNIEKFLKAIFRIKGDAPVPWNTGKNILKGIEEPTLGRLWENEEVFRYYLQCFTRTGSMSGPLAYYKTRELNYKDELQLGDEAKILCPALFIGAEGDIALPPSTWNSQGWVQQIERRKVKGGHWCLVENQGKEIWPILFDWGKKLSRTSAKL
jgi:soluble epoxide hydrolase / lipid-phosphate phosphatase